jgi:predicted dehydrogenase
MASTLRVGILGTGFAGESHAAAYERLPGVEVSALWNRTRSGAESMAAKLNSLDVRVFDEWQGLLSAAECDVISIATAPMLRSAPLLAAVDQGCHVLVEKPMSIGVPEARLMSDAADGAATVTACSFNWRYAPAYQTAIKAIRSGQVGAVRDVRTEWFPRVRRDFFDDGPWRGRMDMSNGVLGEGLSHDFDKARFLTGKEVTAMVSKITSVNIKQDDDLLVEGGRTLLLAELSDGILGQFGLCVTAGEDLWRLLIVGDEGSLQIPDAGTTVIRQRHDDDEPVELDIDVVDRLEPGADLMQHTWNRLIEDFIDAVRDHDLGHERHPNLPVATRRSAY